MKFINRRKLNSFFLLIYTCFILIHIAASTWWLLGMPTTHQSALELKPTTYKHYCKKLHYLVDKQKEICGLNYNILQIISNGAKQGIDECQHQFRSNRWNCTTFENNTKVFGEVVDIKSREKAFVYAISAAGVAYSITKACSTGLLPECGCDNTIRNKDTRGKWEWGGCSDDIKFGTSFSKDFVDSSEELSSADGIMNLHNNEAGRRTLKSNVELVCKCHGVSGSCTVRVCWRKMKLFRNIGEELVRKFDGATHVRIIRKKDKYRLRPLRKDVKKPGKRDLVYLDESPDYCETNELLGVLGTQHRACNASSYGMDGCRLLCCGRGYQTVVRQVEEKCNCKFVWCCKVHCQTCLVKREQHFCN